MREITVSYLLTDEDLERLQKVTEGYRKKGLDLSIEKQFEGIMCYGARYDIDSKLKFHEWELGLREDYK